MIYAQLRLLYFRLGTILQEDSGGAWCKPWGCSVLMLRQRTADID